MKILSNEEYDKLINDKTPTIEYYMNNPYQARKIEKLEDYNTELEIKIDKKDKEIERQKEIIRQLDIKNLELTTILKEVREYVEQHIKYECDNAFNGMQFYSHHLYDFSKKELLEILDKAGDEK